MKIHSHFSFLPRYRIAPGLVRQQVGRHCPTGDIGGALI
jgi:hypothetical protein